MSEMSPFARAGRLLPDYERIDWAATPLGSPAAWGPELRGAVSLVLATRFPATLLWGPEFILVYNEDYTSLIGDKHPRALGRPAEEVFPEAWDTIGPMLTGVLADEGPTWVEDVLLPLQRRGFLEQCYFTFAYSPVPMNDGGVGGVLDITAETTRSVIDRRRLELLGRLGYALSNVQTRAQVSEVSLRVLREAVDDLAAVALYATDFPVSDDDPGLPPQPPAGVVAQLAASERYVEETAAGTVAWLALPSAAQLAPSGASADPGGAVLAVRLSDALAADDIYLEFLRILAAVVAAALDRASAVEEERRSAGVARSMSEVLQRSLLTDPPKPAGMEIVVRYVPAVLDTQIGGDWYDAFYDGNDGLRVVIGDAAGHDRQAAAAMGQARNVLRGIAHSAPSSPAGVLAALDGAMTDLPIDTLATAILGAVLPAADGGHTFIWSNAGHPPPVLVAPGGEVSLLRTEPDLILGLDPSAARADHAVTLPPGSTMLLYTDGLIERRGASIDDGLDWLVTAVTASAGLSAAALCDTLLTQISGRTDDDVAMLALHIHPSLSA